MAIESAADRLAFVREFGATCSLHIGQDDWDASAIFDRAWVDVRGVETYSPTLLVRVEDLYLPGQLQSDSYRATSVNVAAEYGGAGFDIVAYQPDGTGMVTLILEKQA